MNPAHLTIWSAEHCHTSGQKITQLLKHQLTERGPNRTLFTVLFSGRRELTSGQACDLAIRISTSYIDSSDTTWNRGKIINDYGSTDNNGNLKQQTVYVPLNDANTSSTSWYQQYGYDALNRVTQVHEYTGDTSHDWQQAYTYDRYGNRTINGSTSATWGDGINNMQAAAVSSTTTNRMYAPGETESSHPTMDYDAAGNQTKDTYTGAAVTRAYDAENRMTSETQASSYVAGTYTYDGDGRRVKRTVGGVETWQVYGFGGELLAEYAQNADHLNPQKEYGYRNGQMLIEATVPAEGGGTAPTFTDDPLNPPGQPKTDIKLVHLTELRSAVNQLRQRAGLAAITNWNPDPTPQQNVTVVDHNHIMQLREKLEPALTALHLPTGGYAHETIHTGDSIYAVDFQELRDQIKAAWAWRISWLVTDQLDTPR